MKGLRQEEEKEIRMKGKESGQEKGIKGKEIKIKQRKGKGKLLPDANKYHGILSRSVHPEMW